MKRERVGKAEESALLAVLAMGEPAYEVPVERFIERKAGGA